MASKISNFFSGWLNPTDNPNKAGIQFHSQFSIEENSLNGRCIQGICLPEEILLNIFLYLNPQDILKCSLVCKSWCNIAKSNNLWQTLYNLKEYPKKAKNLPWYVFYCYLATNNFTNLLKNGNGESGFEHWTILFNGGDKFVVEDPPAGSDLLPDSVPEFNGHTSCWATSFDLCSKYQHINLSSKRLLRYILKKYKPTLYLSEWYAGRFDCACIYRLAVRCDTEENKWQPVKNTQHFSRRPFEQGGLRSDPEIVEFSTPFYMKGHKSSIEQWSGQAWTKMEITTQNYPSEDVTSLYFCHEGQDCQFWAGHYGSKMAGGVIKFLFDSINPTAEDIDDTEEAL